MPISTNKSIRRMKKATKQLRAASCLQLFKLAVAALPTLVFGIFTVVFTLHQDAAAKATREQDQQQADEINRRIIFKEYIDGIKELLLDKRFSENVNRSLAQMRVQTLTVLRQLDPRRKRDVILYLYENRLLQRDQPAMVDLRGANLSDIRFRASTLGTCNLTDLNLAGVYAENILFEDCLLENAIFQSAVMKSAIFKYCYLQRANFVDTNLTQARFLNNYIYEAQFNGSTLIQSQIREGTFQGTDLINVDLYQSDIDESMLTPKDYDDFVSNRILSSRLPNGAFSEMNETNLLPNGRAKDSCHLNFSSSWVDIMTIVPAKIVNISGVRRASKYQNGSDCFYQIDSRTAIGQFPSLRDFSVLINQKQAVFNLSLCIGTTNGAEQDRISIFVHAAQRGNQFDYSKSSIKIIQKPPLFECYWLSGSIPPGTISFYLGFACNITSTKDQFCYFDDVKLTIHRK